MTIKCECGHKEHGIALCHSCGCYPALPFYLEKMKAAKVAVAESDAPRMTITEFLLARIAEDEALIARRYDGRHHGHNGDAVGMFRHDCPDCQHLLFPHGNPRLLAECKAKRAIIDMFADADPWDREVPDYTGTDVLAHLAAVHADHPDYQQEWA